MIPAISVIVPVWNREKLIERTLDSVLNQTVKPLELIVVDNNSSDNTMEVVKNWISGNSNSGISLRLLGEEKKGACAARQKGLENAKGEYIYFLDSDDTISPDLLKKIGQDINNNPEFDIYCWKCRIKLLNGSMKVPAFIPERPMEGHLIHTLLRPQGYLVRKDFLEKAGGWKKDIKVWNDLELGLRLLLLEPKIFARNEILANIYAQEESISGKDFSSRTGIWEITLNEMEWEISHSKYHEKKRLIDILDYRRSILAALYYLEGNKEGSKNLINTTVKGKSIKKRLLLYFSYYYTKTKLRGAWRIVRYFY